MSRRSTEPTSEQLAWAFSALIIPAQELKKDCPSSLVPVDEAMYAAQWVYENASSLGMAPDRIAVAGESVGANLAAVVAQLARKQGTPAIAFQILLCPLTDWSGDYKSKHTYGTGYFLTSALLDYCASHYLGGDSDRTNPLASPLFGDVAGLPPDLIVTADTIHCAMKVNGTGGN